MTEPVRTVRVVGEDRMVFHVDAKTLIPVSCSCYDAWAHSEPMPGDISMSAWLHRFDETRRKADALRQLLFQRPPQRGSDD